VTIKTKIILIGIDGLILERAINSGRAHRLKFLRSHCYFSEMTVDMPTVSGPSWTTLLTGTTQAIHNVVDNDFTNHKLANAPDFLTQAAQQFGEITTYAAAGWPPLIDPNDIGPVIATRPDDQSVGRHSIFVRDGETNGYESVDFEIAEHAIFTVKKHGPDLSFIYFCGADEAAHLDGTMNGSYFDAIARIDSYLNNLYVEIEDRVNRLNEKWLMVITTDHGHLDEGGHGGDTPQERASFVIAHGIGTHHPDWPSRINPEDLANHILTTL
jgi:predicted AlkP superfamily pyrophosphatase or phosphodiesterase